MQNPNPHRTFKTEATAKMPQMFVPSQVVDVYVQVTGGEVGAASSLAPKIGPLGLFPKKIGEDIAKDTAKDWKGLRVNVKASYVPHILDCRLFLSTIYNFILFYLFHKIKHFCL